MAGGLADTSIPRTGRLYPVPGKPGEFSPVDPMAGASDAALNRQRLQQQLASGQISQQTFQRGLQTQYPASGGGPTDPTGGQGNIPQPPFTNPWANYPGGVPPGSPGSPGYTPPTTFVPPGGGGGGTGGTGGGGTGTTPRVPPASIPPPPGAPGPPLPGAGPAGDALVTSLMGQLGEGQYAPGGLDQSIQSALLPLLQGRGVGMDENIGQDPEARAFRVARERELGRQRNAAAERLSASGTTGSGAFESELAGLRESAGQDIAGFEAGLAGRRRGEKLGEITGAAGLLQGEAARAQGGTETRRGQQLRLFEALTGQRERESQQASNTFNQQLASYQALLNSLALQYR